MATPNRHTKNIINKNAHKIKWICAVETASIMLAHPVVMPTII